MIIPLKHILEPFRRQVAGDSTIVTIAFESEYGATLIDIDYDDVYIPKFPLDSSDPHSLFYDDIIQHLGDIELDTATDYVSTDIHNSCGYWLTLVVRIKDMSKLTPEIVEYLETSGKFSITDHSRNHNVLKRYETRDLDTIRELF